MISTEVTRWIKPVKCGSTVQAVHCAHTHAHGYGLGATWATANRMRYDNGRNRGRGERGVSALHRIIKTPLRVPGWASSDCPWVGTLGPRFKHEFLRYGCQMTQILSCARVQIAISSRCAKTNLNHTADFEGIPSLYS